MKFFKASIEMEKQYDQFYKVTVRVCEDKKEYMNVSRLDDSAIFNLDLLDQILDSLKHEFLSYVRKEKKEKEENKFSILFQELKKMQEDDKIDFVTGSLHRSCQYDDCESVAIDYVCYHNDGYENRKYIHLCNKHAKEMEVK